MATRILHEKPSAILVHCFICHCINLSLQYISRQCKPIRDALDLVYELVGLFKNSPKREAMFVHLQSQSNIHSPQLKPLCPSRWTCCTTSINAVITNYNLLLEELVEINEMH